jgi:hypothetical protein
MKDGKIMEIIDLYMKNLWAKEVIRNYIDVMIVITMLIGSAISSCNALPNIHVQGQQASPDISIEMSETESVEKPKNIPMSTVEPSVGEIATATSVVKNGKQCVETLSKPTGSTPGLEGKIALFSNSLSGSDSYLLNESAGQRTSLPLQDRPNIINGTVSPNGQRLGYLVYSRPSHDKLLLVVKSNGEIEEQYDLAPGMSPWPFQGDNSLAQWLDNDRLILTYGDNPGSDATTLILNPLTGKWKVLNSTYPGLFTIINNKFFWGKFPITRAVYRPALDLLIYPSYGETVLWDLQKQHAVTTFNENNILATTEPVWAPDGGSFIIDLYSSRSDPKHLADRNLFQVFPNGELTPLTSFSGKYPGDFVDYVWSPDGGSVAFWIAEAVENGYPSSYHLAVLNILSHELKEYCISADLRIIPYERWVPVWSPNSQYLVVATSSQVEDKPGQTVLLSLSDNTIQELGDDVFPVGWMK